MWAMSTSTRTSWVFRTCSLLLAYIKRVGICSYVWGVVQIKVVFCITESPMRGRENDSLQHSFTFCLCTFAFIVLSNRKTPHLLNFLSLSLFIDIFKGFGSHLRFWPPLFAYSYTRAITHQDWVNISGYFSVTMWPCYSYYSNVSIC